MFSVVNEGPRLPFVSTTRDTLHYGKVQVYNILIIKKNAMSVKCLSSYI